MLRTVTPQDFTEIQRIHEECKPADWNAESLRTEINLGHAASQLIEDPDLGVLGFVLVRQVGDDCEITSMAVKSSAQAKGWGKKLLLGVKDVCLKKGLAKRLLLEVSVGNLAAIALYEGFGFKPGRIRKGYYSTHNSNNSDALEMSLKIT